MKLAETAPRSGADGFYLFEEVEAVRA